MGDVVFFEEGLTRFERARIISARALQISMGAPVLIKTDSHEPKEIAKQEFAQDVLPITVRRNMPEKRKKIK